MRAPRDSEIIVAIVAGQIIGSLPANADHESPATVGSAVDVAESVVEEVIRRGDAGGYG